MTLDYSKFSFAQMTSNNTGKTSGSGTMGIYIVALGVLMLLFGAWDFSFKTEKPDIMMYASANILVGAGLLGYRKKKEGSDKLPDDTAPNSNEGLDQPPA